MIDELLLKFEQNQEVHSGQCSVLPIALFKVSKLRYSDIWDIVMCFVVPFFGNFYMMVQHF